MDRLHRITLLLGEDSVLKLQKSILELHKMILELSQLAQYQGEMIDNIVDNVSKAKDYVIKGEKHI